jgi:mannose-6-phosphate isomerase
LIINKSWGFEKLLYNGEYCSKLLIYTKPIASSLHYHVKKHETFYIVDGSFLVEIDGDVRAMHPGDHVVIPPGTKHRVSALPRLENVAGVIVESSTHDDPEDCVRLIPSET